MDVMGWTPHGREERTRTLREHADAHGWEQGQLPGDLPSQYPVAPLLGAGSAQAHLVRTGPWEGLTAVVALVSAQEVAPFEREPAAPSPAVDILLVCLLAGREVPRLVLTRTASGVDTALAGPLGAVETTRRVAALLQDEAGPIFLVGDALCTGGAGQDDQVALVHPLPKGERRLRIGDRLALCQRALRAVQG